MKTGWACFRFAKIIYVMPVLMAYTHILFTGTPTQNILAVIAATVGTVAFSILSTAFFVVRMTLVEFILARARHRARFYPVAAYHGGGNCNLHRSLLLAT